MPWGSQATSYIPLSSARVDCRKTLIFQSAPPTPSAGAAILEAGFAGVAECSNRTIDLSALSPLFRDPLAFLDGRVISRKPLRKA